ncbi:MAG: hypothetical protein AABZ74_03075 [Cyanobacteriota bacterium]
MIHENENNFSQEQVIYNLEEISLEFLLEQKFDINLLKNNEQLEEISHYLDLNFINYSESNDKIKIELISQIIVKLLGLIYRYYDENKNHDLIVKLDHLSKLCSYYLETRSYKSSYEIIKKNSKALKVIEYVYKNKTCIVSDIDSLFEDTKQNTSHIISKLENLGIILKHKLGKNVFLGLTSIGLDIYKEYIKDEELDNKKLANIFSLKFPNEKINTHKEMPKLEYISK